MGIKQTQIKTKKVDPTDGMNHMQIFAYLVKNGPTMHGTPSPKVKKSH